jgi:anaerobic magnesium-protoporphyrin IX monomethyl ester cyclase
MVTTRGCPFHCNWCAKPLYGQVYNSRTPANVVDEMLLLRSTIRPDHIWFCDDIFGLSPGWIREFSREVVARRAAIPFKCLARVDLLLKDDMIDDLRAAGCTSVWVGAESGSQKILDAMEKGTTVAQIYEASRRLKEAGIRTGFFLQYGYPGETREDIERTLAMVRDCRPDDIGISVSYPLPGTRFYDTIRESLGKKHNWVNSQDLDLMYPGEFHPDFYRALHRLTHKRLRMWQGADMLRELALSPWKLTPRRLRRIAAMAYHWITLPPLTSRMDALARIT